MRPSNQRRYQRGRNQNQNHSRNTSRQYNRNTSFESNGPNMRVRGTAQQLAEKYQQHARDAGANGDFVLRENFLQHAEYYYRMFEPLDQQNNGAETPYGEQDMTNGGDAQYDANGQGNGGQSDGGYSHSGQDNNGYENGNGHSNGGVQSRQRRRRWEMNGGNANNADNGSHNAPHNGADNSATNAPQTNANTTSNADAAPVASDNGAPTRKPVARRTVRKAPASDAGNPFNGDMPSFLNVDDK